MAKSYKPCCPNHKVDLVDLPFPLTPKGEGVCPISGCHFDYEIELDSSVMEMDKDGKPKKVIKFNVSGDEKS